MDKLVYFIRPAGQVGPIKIGCSVHPEGRLQALFTWSPLPLEIAAAVPGEHADENRLHRGLAKHRLHGEWFAPAPAVLAILDHAKEAGVLPACPLDERAAYFADLYKGGATLKSIGDRFGLTRERVRQVLRQNGCESLGLREEHIRRAEITDTDREVARLYQSGVGYIAIGRQFPGICVASSLQRMKIERRSKTATRKPELGAKVAAAYLGGASPAEIARQFGFPHQTYVYRWLKRVGVDPIHRKGCGNHRRTSQQRHAA